VSVKIFISCVSKEFLACREQLRRDLTRHDVEVKVQEDFKGFGGLTLDVIDVYIGACDAVIHIVGDMTGAAAGPESTRAILKKYPELAGRFAGLREALARGEDISYTQWEAWLAIWHGKPLLIAQAGKAAPRGPDFAPTEGSRAAQLAHLGRLRAAEQYPYCTFDNADQLAKHIFVSPVITDLLLKERGGAPARGAGGFPYAGLAVGLLVLLVTPWIAERWMKAIDHPLIGLAALALTAGGGTLFLVGVRYFGLLGASDAPAGSRDRLGYDDLRDSLAAGGAATQLYARWLTAALDRVDRFFGDAGMADRTLFPHAFGLKTPAPLWTAPAFDRCLLVALVYPIVTIFIMWAVSGHVGPAEEAFGIARDLPGGWRGFVVACAVFCAFVIRQSVHASGWRRAFWNACAFVLVVVFAIAVAPVSEGARSFMSGVFVIVCLSALLANPAGTEWSGAPLAFMASALPVADVIAWAGASVVAGGLIFAGALAFGGVLNLLSGIADRNRWHGLFLFSFVVAMVSGCLTVAHSLPPFPRWHNAGAPLFLFFGLFTLLNAPFDWASLGVTRALLRRGLELKSWWPFFLALADALAAIVIIVLLALTMVIGVQTFDALAVHGGGKPVLPLMPLFDGIAAHPELPEYWWVYALLLSTMIPSLINLAIGGTALMRAIPGLPSLLLRFMPAAGGVPVYDRAWIATVLTAQAALGAILGVAVQAAVAFVLFRYAMPAAGLGLLDLARRLAALDLPVRAIQFFAGA
jgi:hypothetical protein